MSHAGIFETTSVQIDENPVVLIDRSGSTGSYFKKPEGDRVTILQREKEIATKLMGDLGIDKVHLAYWCDSAKIMNNNQVSEVKNIVKDGVSTGGLTYLDVVLSKLPDAWKKRRDMYIITDGELNGNNEKATQLIRELIDSGVCIHIVAIENTSTDYMNSNTGAGNTLYRLIQSQGLTNKVHEFKCFNQKHEEGFMNFYNPTVPPNHFPYQRNIVANENLGKFVCFIADELKQDLSNNEITKIAHNLTLSLFHLTKLKSKEVKMHMTTLFASLFRNTHLRDNIYEMLENEVKAHRAGKSRTFHEYRNEKVNRLEEAQTMLFENVADNITKNKVQEYMTLPVSIDDTTKCIVRCNKSSVNSTLYMRNKKFEKAALTISNHVLPCVPLHVASDNDLADQCLRRWVHANYCHKYPKYTDESSMYLALADILTIYLTDGIAEDVKAGYVELAKILLKETRNNTESSEYKYLIGGNQPLMSHGNEYVMLNMLKRCMTHVGIQNVRVYTFWYALLLMFGDNQLISQQFKYCRKDLEEDFLLKVEEGSTLEDVTVFTNEQNDAVLSYVKRNIDMKFTVYNHMNEVVQAEEIPKDADLINMCKAIYARDDLPLALPYKRMLHPEAVEAVVPSTDECKVNDKVYKMDGQAVRQVISITEDMWKDVSDKRVDTLDDLDFSTGPYTFDKPTVNDTLNSRQLTMDKSEEFKFMAEMRYPFLKDLNMKNVVLAGGFCRSILLKNRMKDFDFFFHGLDNPLPRFKELLGDIMTRMSDQCKNVKFLVLYKPLFNVFEVVCINDPKDFIGENFNLDYFDKFKFNSLHTYDKFTVIDPKKGKVTTRDTKVLDEKKNMTTDNLLNYFEDGDKSGITMMHRFQFVLCRYKSVLDVLNNFDLPASRVAYDGEKVWFTPTSHFAYKYMVNIVNERAYSHMFDNRLSKYFSYGFSIVLPELDMKKLSGNLAINNLKFSIHEISDKDIVVNHDSNLQEKLESNKRLVDACKKDDVSLYKSALFCSLVSICRYVKVNSINYVFVKNGDNLFDDAGLMKFRESEDTVAFIDHIASRIVNYDWYGCMRLEPREHEKTIEDSLSQVESITGNERLLIYNASTARGYSQVVKNPQFNTVVFSGPASKKLAKRYVDTHDQFNLVAQVLDPAKFTRRFVPFASWKDCYDMLRTVPFKNRHVFEIISAEKPCKPYLDIEWSNEDGLINLDVFIEVLKKDLIEVFDDRYDLKIKEEDILVTSSHGTNKVSFHVVVTAKDANGREILFETNKRGNQNSAWDLWYALTQKKSLYQGKLDEYVYSTDREFRTVYSNKNGSEDRPFLPLGQSKDDTKVVDNWEDYLVTSYGSEHNLIKTPYVTVPHRKYQRRETFDLPLGEVTKLLEDEKKRKKEEWLAKIRAAKEDGCTNVDIKLDEESDDDDDEDVPVQGATRFVDPNVQNI